MNIAQTTSTSTRNVKIWVFASVLVSAITVAVVVPIVLRRRNNEESSTIRSTITGLQGNVEMVRKKMASHIPTMFPSSAASVSLAPTHFPSNKPSLAPSPAPSITAHPTDTVSMVPTVVPTNPPSFAPSTKPSFMPSDSPTSVPSSSFAPTLEPISENKVFRLKMYWEKGYYWQEDEDERFWCIECTECKKLNFGDEGDGCHEQNRCHVDDQIWVRDCRPKRKEGHNFQIINVYDASNGITSELYHMIKIEDSDADDADDLCLERTLKRYITVQRCDKFNIRQHWFPLNNFRFDIRPRDDSKDGPQEDF